MKKSPSSLQFVPDWFVTQGQVKIWHDDGDYWDDGKDKFFEWYNGYKKWKAQKAKITTIKVVGLVYVRKQEIRNRRTVGINRTFFCLVTGYKNFFGIKGLQIKMGLELFHKVPAGAIETVCDEQYQPLFKRTELGKYLGIEDIKNNFKGFSSHYTHPRLNLNEVDLFSFLGRTKKPHDIFINLDGSIEIAVRSKKPNAVALVKWLTKKGMGIVPEEHQQTIEEKDATIAFLNDDLKNREYENVGLQGEIRAKD